mgnify:CR=1 FL=1
MCQQTGTSQEIPSIKSTDKEIRYQFFLFRCPFRNHHDDSKSHQRKTIPNHPSHQKNFHQPVGMHENQHHDIEQPEKIEKTTNKTFAKT